MRKDLVVASCLLLSACTAHDFRTSEQRSTFRAAEDYVSDFSKKDPSLVLHPDDGALLIMDLSTTDPTIKSVARGATEESAMRRLLEHTSQPCASSGIRPTIAAFIPPSTVIAPNSFQTCLTLAKSVEDKKQYADELRKLTDIVARQAAEIEHNSKSISENSLDIRTIETQIASVARVQEDSWRRALNILEAMSKKLAGE